MVFPSVPLYLDPPSWNQQHLHQPIISSGGGGGNSTDQPLHHPPPRPVDGGSSGQPPRPNSMAERARMAKIPQPEQALKCPRCDSTNTKFCYFNNYSLTQPRHFCKTCRRYWTRGGALRNVPVGGGCRRNKRSSSSKSSSSKSSTDRPAGASSSSSTATSTSIPALPPPPQMPFLHPMMDYSGGTTNIGLGFHGMQQMEAVDHYQMGNSTGSGVGMEQWRPTLNQIHHFPFLGGLEPQLHPQPPTVSGLYPFDASQEAGKATGSELASQLASVKMEDNPRELNMARRYLGAPRNDQFWDGGIGAGSSTGGASSVIGGGSGGSGGGWMTDLSGFNSSSTGNLL